MEPREFHISPTPEEEPKEPREFRYRPHIKWFQYGIVVFMALLSVLPNLVMAVGTAMDGELYLPSAVMALVFGVMTLVMFWVFRTMASTRVFVDDEGIRYVTHKKDFRVPFDEVAGLDFPAIPYLGGWLKIKSTKPVIRLTVVLEDLDELVEQIKQGLDDADNDLAYDRKKLFVFYKTAAFSTRSWDRAYKAFIPLTVITIAILVVAGFSVPALDDPALSTLFLIPFGAALPFAGWGLGEFLLLISMIRGADETAFSIPERDPVGERRLLMYGYGIYATLVAVCYGGLLMLGI